MSLLFEYVNLTRIWKPDFILVAFIELNGKSMNANHTIDDVYF